MPTIPKIPHIEDRQSIASRLEKDRIWTAYAIADLDPLYSANAEWFVGEDNEALTLVFQGYSLPIVFCVENTAPPASMQDEIDSILCPRKRCIIAKPDATEWIRSRYRVLSERTFVRMNLRPEHFRPPANHAAIRLNSAHLDLVKELYGESTPEFFLDSMLDKGVYYGLSENGQLLAIAGTHVLSTDHKVGGLGNIFTRPDKRNRGYASLVTAAVAQHLLKMGVTTIVLNVMKENDAALRVYKRLGFEAHCRFLEMMVQPK
jgi:ribosomal protein S18 acetylase RimI-like enzyme